MAGMVGSLRWHRGGHGLESRLGHLNLFGCIYDNCLNCPLSAMIISSALEDVEAQRQLNQKKLSETMRKNDERMKALEKEIAYL